MAPNAQQVVVAPGGTIYLAPEGTSEPTTEATALDAAFVDLGYVSEDGVTFRSVPNTEDVGAWQSEYAIRVVSTGKEGSLGFVLREWSAESFDAAFGGGTIGGTAGHRKFSPPSGSPDTVAIVVEWSDGAKDYRIVVPRAQIADLGEIPLRRSAAADLPLTFKILGPTGAGDPWYLLTNDGAFS